MDRAPPHPRPAPPARAPVTRLGVLVLKPSRYDDDGYVIEWRRVYMPSHSLAAVGGIVDDARRREVLGPGVEIAIHLHDETQGVLTPAEIARTLAGYDRALVMMAGVQTNQFPRACDIGRALVAEGIAVVIGGFHVSGTHRLTPDWAGGGLKEAQADGISLFAGELEAGIDELLGDALAARLKPLYDVLHAEVALAASPPALVGGALGTSLDNIISGIDFSRGRPFRCSFCSIINVQGNTMRVRSADAVESYLTVLARARRRSVLVVDDNFARVPNRREICATFERVAEREGLRWDLMIQADTLAYRIPGFVEAVTRAGCRRVFIGIETVTPGVAKAADKGQNTLHLMRDMVMAWKEAGAIIYATMIVGFPTDTPESVRAQLQVFRTELPVDVVEFFVLTPLPGSMDHKRAVEAGVPLDPDLNAYDTEHPCLDHPIMPREDWRALYEACWRDWYSLRNMIGVIDRAVA